MQRERDTVVVAHRSAAHRKADTGLLRFRCNGREQPSGACYYKISFIRGRLSVDKKDQGNARTGRTEIMAAVTGYDFRTVITHIFIVLHIGIAGTDKRFQSPMTADHPIDTPRSVRRRRVSRGSFSLPVRG